MAAVKLLANKGSYHGRANESWRRSRTLLGKAIGVELEVEADDDYADLLNALPEHDRDVDGPQPHFESDGSLSYETGVEIVFPPYSPRSIRDGSAYLMRAASALESCGRLNISSNCGMHMNVNTNGWTPHKLAVFLGVIHNMPAVRLEALGGRRLNDYCRRMPSRRLTDYRNSPGDSHGYAAEHKHGGGRVELRFPGATVDLTVIARLAAFIDYLDDYAHEIEEDWDVVPEDHYPNFIAALRLSEDGEANDLAEFLSPTPATRAVAA